MVIGRCRKVIVYIDTFAMQMNNNVILNNIYKKKHISTLA